MSVNAIFSSETARRAGTRAGISLLAAVFFAFLASSAYPFALLEFNLPDDTAIRWAPDVLRGGLTYSIEETFLGETASKKPRVPQPYHAAIANAFAAWDASSRALRFKQTNYAPVVNCDENLYNATHWEGSAVSGGMGANIDVFSRPADFTYTLLGMTFGFGPGTLAFALPLYTVDDRKLVSVDIFFNEGFNYSVNPVSGQFDVQSVALHEIGHALGLDHPDVADDYGRNFAPFTLEPVMATGDEVMNSTIASGEISRSLTPDEVGGIQFLYGPDVKGGHGKRLLAYGTPIIFNLSGGTEAGPLDNSFVTPEPATVLMILFGAAGLAGAARRRFKR